MSTASELSLNKSLFEICRAMGSSLDFSEVLETILDLSLQGMSAQAGSVLLYEEGSENLKMLAARGLPEEVVKRGHVSRKGSIAEWVIQNNKPMVINDRKEVLPDVQDELPVNKAIRSALCVPLHAKGRIIGTLNINRYDGRIGPFEESDLATVSILAAQAANCIENARLHEQNMQQTRLAAIGQTVAGISHCVKNMLTGLRGSMGILELARRVEDWETVDKATIFLKSNVERISLMVMDMLDYSREKTPIRQRILTEKSIRDVCDIVTYKADNKGATLAVEVSPAAAQVDVDPDQLFRCLLNLMENAIDSLTEGQGRIVVKADLVNAEDARSVFGPSAPLDEMGEIIRISVEDNGSGIDPEHLQTIFQPFYSTKAS
ncbi:GAF domain-containing sensor histidine kinase [bacterium]|nr:GAF domain-containing sensor histidine kinase [bacterium]